MFFPKKKNNQILLGHYNRTRWRSVVVSNKRRTTHTYIVGTTGMGKSKLIEQILYQDIMAGSGCGILDPHGDLIRDLLHYLYSNPQAAAKHWHRIVYCDPTHPDYVIPFNVLHSGLTPYQTAQNIVEAFRRAWPRALESAPRFANIVTAAVLTLIENERPLTDLPALLTHRPFRHQLVSRLQDSELQAFWYDRYDKWGRETPIMIESILNKVTALTLNPNLRAMLGMNENRLDFRNIMDEGKILLVDLGRADSETRRLIGSLTVTGLEQAARTRVQRRPFYFCIDEFQDFCSNDGSSQSLAQILSESRKFGLHLTLAHQTLAQLSPRMVGALGNIQLKVVFGVARQDAELLARQIFQVDGGHIKHTVADTGQQPRSHPVFYSLQEEWEKAVQQLQQLPPQTAVVKLGNQQAPIQMRTKTIRYQTFAEDWLTVLRNKLAAQSGVKRQSTTLTEPATPVLWREPI